MSESHITLDPIMAEVRRVREELSMRFDGDIHRIVEYLDAKARASGHPIVSLPPRPASRPTAPPMKNAENKRDQAA